MGRQIGFYMLLEDEKEFLDFAKSTGDIIIIPGVTKKIPPETIEKLPKHYSKPYWFDFYLFNRVFTQPKYNYIENQKHYTIDPTKSLVIEFFRSGLKENVLKEGRLWVEIKYWDKNFLGRDVIIEKPKEFIQWYEKIVRWLRKNYLKCGSVYISKRVLEWLRQGGKLSVSGHEVEYGMVKRWKIK